MPKWKGNVVGALVQALRPMQWVKNALVFLPLVLAHEWTHLEKIASTALAFILFCMVASAGYICNDLWDVDSDRRHVRKALRPFAVGRLSIGLGVAVAVSLATVAGLIAALLMSWWMLGWLAIYMGGSLLYSGWLKRLLVVDVIMLAGFYTLRVLAGGVAADVPVSPWLLAFCVFFFFSLALVKRYAELMAMDFADTQSAHGRGYTVTDLPIVRGMGIASGCLSVLVLAMYINSTKVTQLYDSPALLWLLCPVLLYWMMRVWMLAQRRLLDDDPIAFAVRDGASYVTLAVVAVVIVAAA